ncbi:sodium-dependent transporter [Paenibacillus alvei]|uniref:Transporter n=1 Tax=Paenibacillus alvei TaxID=44250 RepID=A0ABT4GS58_PAEAL|nr:MULTISPECIES: sodium-dependent transporter [Paenibacillus]EJW18487.1 transporter [Paenibacillus alvei DSM 29]MCY7485177.1 sodium-dependent transporter [Paenibacillus alvei]MCY9539654.1 sodium-dependent transporter [Paenibacillus alvei]MCY9703177.1 sodium-dependent transporter [Paenibacillus alvei]MCY9735603.1 sodium-dependent transporter [Paenibacillus alvei]
MSKKHSQKVPQKVNKSEQFSSAGFILAAIGSSVGLGNMWKFPYVTGQNGGGAFFLLFIACLLIVGLPVLLGELAVGRGGRGDAVSAFTTLSGKRGWGVLGFIAVLAAFLIMTYYSTIAGWTLQYAMESVTGVLFQSNDYAEHFKSFTGGTMPIIWQIVVLALSGFVIARGISGGIEKFNKIVIPGLLIILLIMMVRTLTLDGAAEGISYFLKPDFSQLTFHSALMALGLAFFSLSLGMGAMLTYGAYVDKHQSLPLATAAVGAGDLVYALIAGLIIFPTIFTFGIEPDSGPGLVFVALPAAFASMPYGSLFGGLFFLLLAIAAVTSCLALTEVPVAYIMRRYNLGRGKATTYVIAAMYVIGLPCTLSAGGVWEEAMLGGRNFFQWIDFLTSNVMLPLGGLFVTLLVGYAWKQSGEETGLSPAWRSVWMFTMRIIAPVLIILIFLSSIGLV